jgi:tripartite-type tricarboxylate transporter receptor subunit TctC
MKKTLTTLLAAAGLAFGPFAVAQDNFPSRPVKMIVPYPAGGGGDILARALADAFQKSTGQPMVVENRAGANGMIGATACKSAPPVHVLPARFRRDGDQSAHLQESSLRRRA